MTVKRLERSPRTIRAERGTVVNATALLDFDALLSNAVVRDLGDAADESEALRRALLHCILLLEENDAPAVRNFCTTLLTTFAPLAKKFVKNTHPLFDDVEVMRVRTETGAVTLWLPRERLSRALNLPMPVAEGEPTPS
jgi:hypothetical protein